MIRARYTLDRFDEDDFHVETLDLIVVGEVWPTTDPTAIDPGETAGAIVHKALCRNTGADLLGMLDAHRDELEEALLEEAGLL